jgi:ribosomal protein S18 acetylase RimI-like enzyme
VGIQLLNLSEFDANAYQNSSPLIISQLSRMVDLRGNVPISQELLILTENQDPRRILAGMILPKCEGAFLLADWPLAESWDATEKILTASAEHVRDQESGRPTLLLRKDVGHSEQDCGPFTFLTTIFTYIYSFHDNQSTAPNETQTGESLRIVNVSIDDADTLELLQEIGHDSRDCPELQSMMDWGTRLADYRRSEDVSSINVQQLLHNNQPIGVAVWTESRRSNQVEFKYFGIKPEKRHQGWGARFLNVIFRELRNRKTDCVFLHVDSRNDFAIKLYENWGFEKTEQQELWMGYR